MAFVESVNAGQITKCNNGHFLWQLILVYRRGSVVEEHGRGGSLMVVRLRVIKVSLDARHFRSSY